MDIERAASTVGRLVFAAIFVAIVLLAMIPLAILNGWILTILWGWFVVPIFHLPPLTIAPAMGLSLLVSYMTKEYVNSESTWKNVSITFTRPFMVLLIGYIIKSYM